MADRPQIEFTLVGESDLDALQSFYSSVGYGGGLKADDLVLVARRGDTIVATAKLSPNGDTLVLRGMYVSEPLRGLGIGAALLERVSKEKAMTNDKTFLRQILEECTGH
jgi:GNAT superfamily N-acetyltransferase